MGSGAGSGGKKEAAERGPGELILGKIVKMILES